MGRMGIQVAIFCCLPLVLPPGWCCWLLTKIDPAVSTFAPARRTNLVRAAGLCCCHTHQPQPESDNDTPPKPRTPPLEQCPCSDRHTTPPSFNSVGQDLGPSVLATILPFDLAPLPVTGGFEKVVPVPRPPSCPLHVRLCVWRC